MQEFHDGTFGEAEDSMNLLERLLKSGEELAKTKAIHFGAEDELEQMKRDQQSKRDRMRARRQLK